MSAEPPPMVLVARDVSAGYGKREVLHRASLEVAAGELLAIVGPNGAGKSTLLRVLGGSLRPWAGSVELLGRPLEEFNRREIARRIACVAQENPAAFHFTVLEVVLMGRAPHLAPMRFEGRRDLELAHAALARFGLLGLAGRFVQDLSGGERKRVFLARALVQEPVVALLDEPTAFLDLKHVAELFELFKELRAERGLAVVATLHDLNAASLYADRVMLLKNGVPIGTGRPEEVLTVANLRQVYDTDVFVARSPVTGAVVVFPAGRAATGRISQ